MNATNLLVGVLSGALVVISGGTYALFLALGRLRGSKILMRLSSAAYLVLVVSVLVLADSLALSMAWYFVVVAMLAGYWLLPKAIWHLSAATHSPETSR